MYVYIYISACVSGRGGEGGVVAGILEFYDFEFLGEFGLLYVGVGAICLRGTSVHSPSIFTF